MGTSIRTTVLTLAGCAIAVSATAQTPSSSLAEALSRSVCERVQMPLAFATRDTAFALSLPQDEPATIFLQVTVGKNGKVREKLTRVDANHLAGYVAPAFVAATKDLRIDRALLAGMTGKDTSLTLAFPLEYQCVYDTMNKAWPDMTPETWQIADLLAPRAYWHDGSNSEVVIQKRLRERGTISMSSSAWYKYSITKPTRIWYYLVFLKDQPE